MGLLIRNYYTRNIPIDDGYDGEAVAAGETFPVRIRRFTVAQLKEFQRGFHRVVNPTAERFIFRKPDGDEQAMREDGKTRVHVIPDAEITRRRLEEMDQVTRDRYDAASVADDEFMADFCSKAIAENVSVDPAFVLNAQHAETGQEFQVKTGADLVAAFGGNLSMLTRLTQAIHLENTLSPETKKALRSLSGSTTSSPAPGGAAEAAGATPAATATNAEAEGSAPSGAASTALDQTPSGSDGSATSS